MVKKDRAEAVEYVLKMAKEHDINLSTCGLQIYLLPQELPSLSRFRACHGGRHGLRRSSIEGYARIERAI
jgi:hypothetical protein